MPIEVTSVYTKRRLIRYQIYVATSKKFFWTLVIVGTLLVFAVEIVGAALTDVPFSMSAYHWFLLAWDALCVFLYFVLPFLLINKNKSLNTIVNFTFDQDTISYQSTSALINENSTVRYAMLVKAIKKGSELYLFINGNQAYLVDLSTLSSEQINCLKDVLTLNLSHKKVKWKS